MSKFQTYLQTAVSILREHPVLRVGDFEALMEERVKPAPEDYNPLAGRKRKKWQNWTDWAKAELTRRGLIKYQIVNGEKHIVSTESPTPAPPPGPRTLDSEWEA